MGIFGRLGAAMARAVALAIVFITAPRLTSAQGSLPCLDTDTTVSSALQLVVSSAPQLVHAV